MYLRKLSLIATLVAVTACSPSGSETPASAANPDTRPDTSCPETPQFYEPIKGFRLDVPFHFRSDKTYVHRVSGQNRRAIVLEYLDGDQSTATAALGRSLKGAGYVHVAEAVTSADGVTSIRFKKDGSPEIYAEISDKAGEYPSNKDAIGVITISWKI